MPISYKKYVDITSGVGAGTSVANRDMGARMITQNSLLPPKAIFSATDATEVGDFFGLNSQEFKRATQYFSFVSKAITKPKKISFSRWTDAATAPTIVGSPSATTLTAFQAVTTGQITFVINNVNVPVSTINLSAATSLADVATRIQTAVNGNSNTQLATATISYNTTTKRYVFTGGVTGADQTAITVVSGGANDLSLLLGWDASAIYGAGADAQTALEAIVSSVDIDNNFGSFCYLDEASIDQVVQIAQWNKSLNNEYMFSIACYDADIETTQGLLKDIGGTAITMIPNNSFGTYFGEQIPMEIMAATDYTRFNAAQNYMYQNTDLAALVSTTALSDRYDALRANYVGITQVNGQTLKFYQTGYLMGSGTDAVDMGVYANEIWLKSSIAAQAMSLFLNENQVPANDRGIASFIAIIQPVLNQAIDNGTISTGKTLNATQKLFITQQTNDPNAWHQVQNTGYWLDAVIQSYVDASSVTKYKIVYTLVYSKDDVVRKVEGSNDLI